MKGADYQIQNLDGDTPMHLAASNRSSETLTYLIEVGNQVHEQNFAGNSTLHLGARSGCEQNVTLLIAQGADTDEQKLLGKTLVHLAAQAGHYPVIELLLQAGAESKIPNKFEKTALMRENCHRSIRYMDFVEPLNHEIEQALLKLHSAAGAGKKLLVRLLLEEDGEDISLKDSAGRTALHYAVKAGSAPVTTLLISYGADLEAMDRNGIRPYKSQWTTIS